MNLVMGPINEAQHQHQKKKKKINFLGAHPQLMNTTNK
jgi:hypothetical protein